MKDRFVTDLGLGAYLLMHGFQVSGKKLKAVYYECGENERENFDTLIREYMPPSDFYLFDACLMSLKKNNPWLEEVSSYPHTDKENIEVVTDMGQAAYILMKEYLKQPNERNFKVIGRGRNKEIYFLVNNEDKNEFKRTAFTYLSSPFHNFDACLMTLRKIGEYIPN